MATKVTGIECLYSLVPFEILYDEKAEVSAGDKVIFKNSDGEEEYAIIKYVNADAPSVDKTLVTSKILRRATAHDLQKVENNVERTEGALNTCRDLVNELRLDMAVFKAAYSFDSTKIYFIFTAEERVDFRELVKLLAQKLKKQIHLRQIGPRDKARFIGGHGRCGRELCCHSFLNKIESVNMEMVRDQGLEGKGSSKLSGVCGKLLCCLKYEVEAYHDLRKSLPDIGSSVSFKKTAQVPGKEGRVVAVDILNQKVRVYFPEVNESIIVKADEIEKVAKPVRAKKIAVEPVPVEPTDQ